MRSQILELVRQCGFKYVRISNIFSDSRMLKNPAGYSDYNFNELDQVLDFLWKIIYGPTFSYVTGPILFTGT